MRRRALLATVAGGLTLAGCVGGAGPPAASTSPSAEPTDSDQPSTASPAKETETATAVHRTADGVTATFRVVDGHIPTEDSAHATFDGREVTVTGTIDPAGCNRPTLDAVSYDASAGRVELVVGEKNPYGETATIECGNASFDFRCVVTVDDGEPSVVDVTYDRSNGEDRTFTVEKD